MNRLSGKIVVVTGSGAGIGEHICRRFAGEGATVIGMDRDPAAAESVARAVSEGGGSAHAHGADVSSRADCSRVCDWVRERYGTVHVLCNVAGIVEFGTLVECSEESWQRTLDVNVKGMYYMCQRIVPMMIDNGGGSIVNIASVAGPFAVRNLGAYTVSKAAVIGLTKSLAIDFVGEGIRVNAICPSTVDSPSWRERLKQHPDGKQALQNYITRQPMGRVSQPEEIAALAAYLASDEAAYLTGQAIFIDGGMTL